MDLNKSRPPLSEDEISEFIRLEDLAVKNPADEISVRRLVRVYAVSLTSE